MPITEQWTVEDIVPGGGGARTPQGIPADSSLSVPTPPALRAPPPPPEGAGPVRGDIQWKAVHGVY
ncbi:hypothetical protein MBOURGENBZM_03950 [Methanoculleus bourgensis]|nr:hypothetical protein MBOURGENBZM_03950 [Methanoculleus bourgensis]